MKTVNRTVSVFIVLLAALISLVSCKNGGDSYVPNRIITATLPPYNEVSAEKDCKHQMRDVITLEDGEHVSACIYCGYSDSGYRYYHAKNESDTYVMDSKIIIKLSSEFNHRVLHFRSDVDEVIFIGTEGQLLDGLKISVQKRQSDFTIGFCNVNIISDGNIVDSTQCSEKVTIKTYGNENSFTTRTGANGADGTLEYVDFHSAQAATAGSRGEDAADVFLIKGDVDVYAYATFSVTGGNGGKGGNGGSHKQGPQYVAKNNGGNGGSGGNGADVFCTDGVVTVRAGEEYLDLNAGSGGAGGTGGAGGGGLYNSQRGNDGSRGTDGVIGLE